MLTFVSHLTDWDNAYHPDNFYIYAGQNINLAINALLEYNDKADEFEGYSDYKIDVWQNNKKTAIIHLDKSGKIEKVERLS